MGEKLADVWVLLSDTDRFVSRARLMKRYEGQLRRWRSELNESRGDTEGIRGIREEIIAFRRARRAEGWELRLGSLDIQLKGFRKDDALSAGFQRIVLMVGENGDIRYITGTANHIELDRELNLRLRQSPSAAGFEPHYLWYRRTEGVIELAGADSQPRESHENLKQYIERHKSDLVKAMYKLS